MLMWTVSLLSFAYCESTLGTNLISCLCGFGAISISNMQKMKLKSNCWKTWKKFK